MVSLETNAYPNEIAIFFPCQFSPTLRSILYSIMGSFYLYWSLFFYRCSQARCFLFCYCARYKKSIAKHENGCQSNLMSRWIAKRWNFSREFFPFSLCIIYMFCFVGLLLFRLIPKKKSRIKDGWCCNHVKERRWTCWIQS